MGYIVSGGVSCLTVSLYYASFKQIIRESDPLKSSVEASQ